MITPRYEFEERKIQLNYCELKKKLSLCTIHYALKANANDVVLNTLAKCGSSFECASDGELDALIKNGIDIDKIIYAQVIKTNE